MYLSKANDVEYHPHVVLCCLQCKVKKRKIEISKTLTFRPVLRSCPHQQLSIKEHTVFQTLVSIF